LQRKPRRPSLSVSPRRLKKPPKSRQSRKDSKENCQESGEENGQESEEGREENDAQKGCEEVIQKEG
jgi:hypothetical protein